MRPAQLFLLSTQLLAVSACGGETWQNIADNAGQTGDSSEGGSLNAITSNPR